MIKENKELNIYQKLKVYDLNYCYIIPENIDQNFMKLFGFDSDCSSKCIIINNIGKISLIFEDYIEFLTEAFQTIFSENEYR